MTHGTVEGAVALHGGGLDGGPHPHCHALGRLGLHRWGGQILAEIADELIAMQPGLGRSEGGPKRCWVALVRGSKGTQRQHQGSRGIIGRVPRVSGFDSFLASDLQQNSQ